MDPTGIDGSMVQCKLRVNWWGSVLTGTLWLRVTPCEMLGGPNFSKASIDFRGPMVQISFGNVYN